MNRIFTTLAFLSLVLASAQAQQMPLFTQYREMQGVINPAAINYGFFTDRHKGSVAYLFAVNGWICRDRRPLKY